LCAFLNLYIVNYYAESDIQSLKFRRSQLCC